MSTLTKLKENIESVIVGKGKVIDMVMTSLIAGGHILLEDVPGTGKTVNGQVTCPLFGCLLFPCTVYTRFAAI